MRVLHRSIDILCCCIFPVFYDTGISKYYRMIWNIAIYKAVCSNQYIIADVDLANNSRVHTNPHIISDHRISRPFSAMLFTDRHSLMEIDVLPKHRTWVDCNTVRVSDIKTRSNLAIH